MTIPGFSAYLMSSHGNGGCYLSYTDESKKVAIQAQHSVTKIGANEGGSGAFVRDFLVEDLRAVMQALNRRAVAVAVTVAIADALTSPSPSQSFL